VFCQEVPVVKCPADCYRDADSFCRSCVDVIWKTVFENRDTKYEDCRKNCFNKTQYPCYNMGKICSDITQSYNWLWYLLPAFLAGAVLGMLVTHLYNKTKYFQCRRMNKNHKRSNQQSNNHNRSYPANIPRFKYFPSFAKSDNQYELNQQSSVHSPEYITMIDYQLTGDNDDRTKQTQEDCSLLCPPDPIPRTVGGQFTFEGDNSTGQAHGQCISATAVADEKACENNNGN